jgi:hypothetical protein
LIFSKYQAISTQNTKFYFQNGLWSRMLQLFAFHCKGFHMWIG